MMPMEHISVISYAVAGGAPVCSVRVFIVILRFSKSAQHYTLQNCALFREAENQEESEPRARYVGQHCLSVLHFSAPSRPL